MNNDAVSNEEFYARLGIEAPVKAKSIREVMVENAQRVADAQAFLTRVDATAIKSGAKPWLI